MNILFTAFRGKNNSSSALLAQINGNKLLLTNSFAGLKNDIENIDEVYDFVLMFGLDKTLKNEVRIEKIAKYEGNGIVTRIDLALVSDAFDKENVKNSISSKPTQYLCNAAYYHMLRKTDGKAVFIHIPTLKNMNESFCNCLIKTIQKEFI